MPRLWTPRKVMHCRWLKTWWPSWTISFVIRPISIWEAKISTIVAGIVGPKLRKHSWSCIISKTTTVYLSTGGFRWSRHCPLLARLSIGPIKLTITQLLPQISCNSMAILQTLQHVLFFLSSVMSLTQNMFILSPLNMSDLTSGLGNLWLNTSNFKYNTWRGIY